MRPEDRWTVREQRRARNAEARALRASDRLVSPCPPPPPPVTSDALTREQFMHIVGLLRRHVRPERAETPRLPLARLPVFTGVPSFSPTRDDPATTVEDRIDKRHAFVRQHGPHLSMFTIKEGNDDTLSRTLDFHGQWDGTYHDLSPGLSRLPAWPFTLLPF